VTRLQATQSGVQSWQGQNFSPVHPVQLGGPRSLFKTYWGSFLR